MLKNNLIKKFQLLPINKRRYLISLMKTSIALLISIPLMVFEMLFMFKSNLILSIDGYFIYGWIVFVLSIFIVFGLGFSFFKGAFFEVFKWKKPGMSLLVVISTCVAFIYSTYSLISNTIIYEPKLHGFFETACMIIATMSVGQLVSDRIKLKANQDLQSLNNLQVKKYNSYDLNTKQVSEKVVFQAKINEYALVKKGEIVPLDGVLYSQIAEVDESSLTGEARPILKTINNDIIAGSINVGDNFIFKITKLYNDSTIKKIINGVNQIASSKPKIQVVADKISLWFTPFILLMAILAFLLQAFVPSIQELPIAFLNLHGSNNDSNLYEKAAYVAVSVLVISCPCAFAIAVPLAVLIGAGHGAKSGITFNNSNIFEKIKKVNAIAFDKTGTLTYGKLQLKQVIGNDQFLDLIYQMELISLHPLAKSFVTYAIINNIVMSTKLIDIKEVAGVGIIAKDVDGNIYELTSEHYANENQFDFSLINQKSSTSTNLLASNIIFSINKKVQSILVFEDEIRADAYETIKVLHENNIETYMITGDSFNVAQKIAKELGIKHFYAQVKPEEKANIIKKIQNDQKTVMYVGDGINDLLALKQANVSISIGETNKATNAVADISLIKPDILNIYKVIKLTKITKMFIVSSLLWAFGYNLIFIPLALIGIIPPFISVLIMTTSDIAVVLNSLIFRLLKMRLVNKKQIHKLNLKIINEAMLHK
ncbi:cation-translocating P-type ATPase [Ureaplasma parvum]|uniref:heavy metal translocating P-type ATPase n=1 Tax=Ureaplasma parvum TaxID=134821 RepID=UPI00307CE971